MIELNNIVEDYQKLKETNFHIKNVITETTKFLFILESPHVKEIENQMPVCGVSGKSMTKALFNNNYSDPLGILIKKNLNQQINEPLLLNVGLMNICQIPMQGNAYKTDENIYLQFTEFFKSIEKIRLNKVSKEEKVNMLNKCILKDFIANLNRIENREIYIIPCGKTAEYFFNKSNVLKNKWIVINNIPHPSHNRWQQIKYKTIISDLIQLFKF